MSYILVIVESPAKCEKIEKFLGAGYKVIGSYGHITHLSNLDQIDVKNNYKPSFAIIDTKKAQIEKMRKAIKGAKEVILATVIFTVSLQVLMPLLTVAIYEVVAVGFTVMDWVVAVVDQR